MILKRVLFGSQACIVWINDGVLFLTTARARDNNLLSSYATAKIIADKNPKLIDKSLREIEKNLILTEIIFINWRVRRAVEHKYGEGRVGCSSTRSE